MTRCNPKNGYCQVLKRKLIIFFVFFANQYSITACRFLVGYDLKIIFAMLAYLV